MKQAKRFKLKIFDNWFEIDRIVYFIKKNKPVKELVSCKKTGKIKDIAIRNNKKEKRRIKIEIKERKKRNANGYFNIK